MYELLPHSLSSLYCPFPRYSRTTSLSLAFSLDLSELLNTISPTANSFEGKFGLRCVAALLDRCFLMMSCCENFNGAPDVMSLLVHSSDADMPVQRSLAFSAEIALDSSSSEICPPAGVTPSMASWTSLLFFSATGLPFLLWALLRSILTPMSASVLFLKRLMKLLALSVRHMRNRVALEGPTSAKRHRSPDSSSSAVSFWTNLAHVWEVAVSLRVRIFCFSLSMTSVANCWPNVSGVSRMTLEPECVFHPWWLHSCSMP